MKFLACLASVCVLLSACATAGTEKPIHYVILETIPEGGTITFESGQMCDAPCRVGVIEQVKVRVGRTGYKAGEIILTRSSKKHLKIKLEPVIVDTEIESFELPDLQ